MAAIYKSSNNLDEQETIKYWRLNDFNRVASAGIFSTFTSLQAFGVLS